MTDNNKKTLIDFAKVVALGILGFAGIITIAGVWNAVTLGSIGSFYGWIATLNLGTTGFGVYSLYKKLFPKVEKKAQDNKVE